jgi:hypothetical protein
MDRCHREKQPDTRIARICSFCMRSDADFARRQPWDQLVQGNLDTTSGHLTDRAM